MCLVHTHTFWSIHQTNVGRDTWGLRGKNHIRQTNYREWKRIYSFAARFYRQTARVTRRRVFKYVVRADETLGDHGLPTKSVYFWGWLTSLVCSTRRTRFDGKKGKAISLCLNWWRTVRTWYENVVRFSASFCVYPYLTLPCPQTRRTFFPNRPLRSVN